MENEINAWKREMDGQSKLRVYKQIKHTFEPEPYVTSTMSKSSRSFIAQLRSGTLPLMIEIGRFQQKDPGERMCPICNDTVEDELHFVFHCPLYATLREGFVAHIRETVDDNILDKSEIEKLEIFMKCTKFGAFIKDCYFKRTDFIYTS